MLTYEQWILRYSRKNETFQLCCVQTRIESIIMFCLMNVFSLFNNELKN